MSAHMYIHFELRSGLRFGGPGCVILPGIPRSFGLSADGARADGLSFVRGIGLFRLLLALLAALTLVWGTLHGHAIEGIAAVLAAVLVDAIGAFLRGRTEVRHRGQG
ncbi:hypothetical protein GTY41_01505 [Streptomyces sp. SID685]|nr:hypothetical protein [Streptomyces sp. SID685]